MIILSRSDLELPKFNCNIEYIYVRSNVYVSENVQTKLSAFNTGFFEITDILKLKTTGEK